MPDSAMDRSRVLRLHYKAGVAIILLDRPPVNALDAAACLALEQTLSDLAHAPEIHCILLTAPADRPFCAGRDFKELAAMTPERELAGASIMRSLFDRLLNHPLPLVAAVSGVAVGLGTVLTALCDIRLASPTARFALPEINVGRAGGVAFLSRFAMPGIVRRMALTGEPISAEEARRIGLVDEIVASDMLYETALTLARTIAAKPPLGVRAIKCGLNAVAGLPPLEGYKLEQSLSADLATSHDSREALRAIIEKRVPRFRGR